jgi:DNA-binding SARP family transcriptional activator
MWVGLLGPLSVQAAGRTLEISAEKQRVLLAVLAARPGSPVSVGDLADEIWNFDRPATWAETLRNYVKRLRQALGTDLGWRIANSPAAYRLDIDPANVDFLVFESLCEAGTIAAENGD